MTQIEGTAVECTKHHNIMAVNEMRYDLVSGTNTGSWGYLFEETIDGFYMRWGPFWQV